MAHTCFAIAVDEDGTAFTRFHENVAVVVAVVKRRRVEVGDTRSNILRFVRVGNAFDDGRFTCS